MRMRPNTTVPAPEQTPLIPAQAGIRFFQAAGRSWPACAGRAGWRRRPMLACDDRHRPHPAHPRRRRLGRRHVRRLSVPAAGRRRARAAATAQAVARILAAFFPWVWASAVLLVATGYWMLVTHFGGFGGAPPYVDIMQALGWLMILLFVLLFHGPWLKFKRAVDAEDWPAAARQPQPHPHHHRDQPAARPHRRGGRRHREVLGVLGVSPGSTPARTRKDPVLLRARIPGSARERADDV